METPDNNDVQLNEQNFRRVCRLCLGTDEDDEFVDIFRKTDEKQPIVERVFELYHLKVTKNIFFF